MRLLGLTPWLIAAFLFGSGSLAAERPPKKKCTNCVVVTITGFDNNRGRALVALFRSSAGFPNQVKKAADFRAAAIKNKRVTVVFKNVKPGAFAIGVHHDQDGDYKMATNWLGAPKEAYGASRNARRRFGPPRYKDAMLTLNKGEQKRVRIVVR